MWPLSLVLLFATAAPLQHDSSGLGGAYKGKIPQIQAWRGHGLQSRRLSPQDFRDRHTCYTMRSYFFRRQDGQAPVPAGMTTCTPASVLQQRQISPAPDVKFVPLGMQQEEKPQREEK